LSCPKITVKFKVKILKFDIHAKQSKKNHPCLKNEQEWAILNLSLKSAHLMQEKQAFLLLLRNQLLSKSILSD